MTIFFDFDGTLIDVKLKYYKIYTDFIAKYDGKALHIDEFWELKRSVAKNDVICSKSFIDSALGEELKTFTKDNIETAAYLDLDSPFDDVVDVFSFLKEKGVNINIISMRRNDTGLKYQVEKLGLKKYLDGIYSPFAVLADKIKEGDPLSKSLAIRSLGSWTDKAILIGDSGMDLTSAKDLGWQSVGVLTGIRDRAELEKYKPDYIIDKLTDFKNLYEKYEHTFC